VNNRFAAFLVVTLVLIITLVATHAHAQSAAPSKVGIIDIQRAVMSTNEGKRELDALNKKYEPRQAGLQKQRGELEELGKQLSASDKMTDDARVALLRSLEQKQIALRHDAESAQTDYQAEQREIVSRILKKMAPIVDKYAKDNGYTMIFDAQFWPQGPVLWASAASADVTGAIVSAYNAQVTAAAPAQTPPSRLRQVTDRPHT
jgi:outer membrane protein